MKELGRVGPKQIWTCKASECTLAMLRDALERNGLSVVSIEAVAQAEDDITVASWTYRTPASTTVMFAVEHYLATNDIRVLGIITYNREDLLSLFSILRSAGFQVKHRKSLLWRVASYLARFFRKRG